MHSLSLSHFHVATQNRSCWHCFLLPAYSKLMPLPQTWIWYSLLPHNAPLFKRTLLSLSPLLSTLPRNQLSRALAFEEAHSSWQYLFLAPICVHISVLTEYPWYSSQCHQHSGVGSWNRLTGHTQLLTYSVETLIYKKHIDHSHCTPTCMPSWYIFAGFISLKSPIQFCCHFSWQISWPGIRIILLLCFNVNRICLQFFVFFLCDTIPM